MSKFRPVFTNDASVIEYTDGAMIFDTSTKKLRFDVNNQSYEIESGRSGGESGNNGGGTATSLEGFPEIDSATVFNNFLKVQMPLKKEGILPSFAESTSAEYTGFYINRNFAQITNDYFVTNFDDQLAPTAYIPAEIANQIGMSKNDVSVYRLAETDPIFDLSGGNNFNSPLSVELMVVPSEGAYYFMLAVMNKNLIDTLSEKLKNNTFDIANDGQSILSSMIFPLVNAPYPGADGSSEFQETIDSLPDASLKDEYFDMTGEYSLADLFGNLLAMDNGNKDTITFSLPEGSNYDFLKEYISKTFGTEIGSYYEGKKSLGWGNPLPAPTSVGQVLKVTDGNSWHLNNDDLFDTLYLNHNIDITSNSSLDLIGVMTECMGMMDMVLASESVNEGVYSIISTAAITDSKNFYNYDRSSETFSKISSIYEFPTPTSGSIEIWHKNDIMMDIHPANPISFNGGILSNYNDFMLLEKSGESTWQVASESLSDFYDDNEKAFVNLAGLRKYKIVKPVTLPWYSFSNSRYFEIDESKNTIYKVSLSSDGPDEVKKVNPGNSISLWAYDITYNDGDGEYYYSDNGGSKKISEESGSYFIGTPNGNNTYILSDLKSGYIDGMIFIKGKECLTATDDWRDYLWGYACRSGVFYEDSGVYREIGNNGNNYTTGSDRTLYIEYELASIFEFDSGHSASLALFLATLNPQYTNGIYTKDEGTENSYTQVHSINSNTTYYINYGESYIEFPEPLFKPIALTSSINGETVFNLNWLGDNSSNYVLTGLRANGIEELVFDNVGVAATDIEFGVTKKVENVSEYIAMETHEDGFNIDYHLGNYFSIEEGTFGKELGNPVFEFAAATVPNYRYLSVLQPYDTGRIDVVSALESAFNDNYSDVVAHSDVCVMMHSATLEVTELFYFPICIGAPVAFNADTFLKRTFFGADGYQYQLQLKNTYSGSSDNYSSLNVSTITNSAISMHKMALDTSTGTYTATLEMPPADLAIILLYKA